MISSQWHNTDSRGGKRQDERFDHLPPLHTIPPEELKNYTRKQLRWYLTQRGIEPEETKPKMKAQLRAVLREIRVDDPQSKESTKKTTRPAPTSNTDIVNMAAPKQLPPGTAPLPLSANINTMALYRKKANLIPCPLPIRKAPHRHARPFLNLRVQPPENQQIHQKSETIQESLDLLLGGEEASLQSLHEFLPHRRSGRNLEQRKAFLLSLKGSLATEPTESSTRKYFKSL